MTCGGFLLEYHFLVHSAPCIFVEFWVMLPCIKVPQKSQRVTSPCALFSLWLWAAFCKMRTSLSRPWMWEENMGKKQSTRRLRELIIVVFKLVRLHCHHTCHQMQSGMFIIDIFLWLGTIPPAHPAVGLYTSCFVSLSPFLCLPCNVLRFTEASQHPLAIWVDRLWVHQWVSC